MRRLPKEDKERALLVESEEWEKGRRGGESVAANPEEEAQIESKLNLQMISLRLPSDVLDQLKREASEHGQKYQPYVRQLLVEHARGRSTLEERVQRLERHVMSKLG